MVVPPTRVRVSIPQPQTHLLHVEVRTPDLSPGVQEFFMPVWTPGSYLVREYARHVESMEAFDGDGGPLAVQKTAKNRWAVRLAAPGDVLLRYRVYARDLTVRTNFVDARRAYWNGAATYVVAVERRDAPLVFDVDAPQGWTVHCTLPVQDGERTAWTLDEAVDAPFVVSDAPATSFAACGVEHGCVWDGVPEHERERLTGELEKIVTSAASIFGGELPYERYLFLVFADAVGSGGLEHAESCVVHVSRAALRKEDVRQRVLGLFAHEHFHAWNVKRIRPAGLERFDYENENYTRDLWLAEGFTSYYQELIPYAAGLYTRPFLLERLARTIGDVLTVPGRRHQSVSDSSFDAWIKLYRPDETTRNTTVSYYSKGAVVALALDLLIQARSDARRSLDDVMRGLWDDYRQRGPGQGRDRLLACVEAAAGESLAAELALLVDGTDDPPLDQWMAPFGLRFVPASGPEQAVLGIRTKVEDGALKVASVERGGAAWTMGISPDDELIAIDRERVPPQEWATILKEQMNPGQEVEIHLFRRGLLTSVRGRLGASASGNPQLVETEAPLRYRP